MGPVRGGEELLPQQAAGAGLDPQASLFHHDVALRVELPQHRVADAVAVEDEPQLGAIGGQGEEVVGDVVAGRGVEALRPVLGEDAVQLVAHVVLAGRILELPQAAAQARERTGVGLVPLTELGGERVGHHVDAGEDRQLGRIVLGADRARALEQHVLEEMGRPRDPRPLVHAAGAEVRHEGDGGRPFAAQE